MDAETFLYWIDDPNRINDNDLEQLEDLAREYPYFQLAHQLIAKGTKNKPSVALSLPVKLRKASLYAYNRAVLRQLMEVRPEDIQIIPAEQPIDPYSRTAPDLGQAVEADSTNETFAPIPVPTDEEPEAAFVPTPEEDTTPVSHDPTADIPTTPAAADLPASLEEIALNEGIAMDLFNDGRIEEAILVYQHLAAKQPDKHSYYQTQLQIMTDNDYFVLQVPEDLRQVYHPTQDTPAPQTETPDTTSFFDTLPPEETPSTPNNAPEASSTTGDETAVTEFQASQLYENGQYEAAIEAYQQLSQQEPDRAAFYALQIQRIERAMVEVNNLLVEDETSTSTQAADSDVVDTPEVDTASDAAQSFFDQIGFEEETTTAPTEAPADNTVVPETAQSFFDQITPEEETTTTPTEAPADNTVVPETAQSFFDQIGFEEETTTAPTEAPTDNTVVPETAQSFFDQISSDQEVADIDTPVQESTPIDTTPVEETTTGSFFDALTPDTSPTEDVPVTPTNQWATEEPSNPTTDFFDTIEEDTTHEPVATQPTAEEIIEPPAHISEGTAMQAFNEGNVAQAVEIYQALMRYYPEKTGYYQGQIDILTDGLDIQNLPTGSVEEAPDVQDYHTVAPPLDAPNNPEEPYTLAWSISDSPKNEDPAAQVPLDLDNTPAQETPTPSERLALRYFQDGDIAKAVDTYAQLQTIDPEKADYYQSQIDILTEGVQEQSTQTEPSSPKTPAVSEELAMRYFNEGNTDQAIEIYKKLMLQNPDKERYYLNQIEILTDDLETLPNTATEALPYTTEKNIDNSAIPEENTNFAPSNDVSESMAIALFNQGKLDEAVLIYQQLMQKYPEKRDYFKAQIDVLKS